ncbi:hypothetical protein ACFPVS_00160 [Neisseria weixii]|nr:hypothetical protein [Neisseria weixii]
MGAPFLGFSLIYGGIMGKRLCQQHDKGRKMMMPRGQSETGRLKE